MTAMRPNAYYRNKEDMQIDGEHVDAGSLWEYNNYHLLILVDDDRFVSHALTDGFQ